MHELTREDVKHAFDSLPSVGKCNRFRPLVLQVSKKALEHYTKEEIQAEANKLSLLPVEVQYV